MPDDSADRTRTEASSAESNNDDSTPLKRLGDFELLREIGRGGMGVVYEARQISLKRRVALKVLPPALGMSAQAKQRFEREAQAAAKLHHTNIVPVHAIGEHDGHHFYAMELIDGQSLDHVLRDMVDEGANPLMETAVTQTATELRPQRAVTSSQDQATTSLSDSSAGGREWFYFGSGYRRVRDQASPLSLPDGLSGTNGPSLIGCSERGRACDYGGRGTCATTS